MDRTLVLLKPDALQRGLIGELIRRFEKKGLVIRGIKMIQLSDQILAEHYAHIVDKPFYPRVKKFMQSSPVIALCITGRNAVNEVRRMTGATNCQEAKNGTLRAELGNSISANLLHTSDPDEDPEAEIQRFFTEDEICQYDLILEQFIYES